MASSTCSRKAKKRHVQRWNFPFKSLDIAKLYLRTADFTMKKPCGIYEIENEKGRKSYKIYANIIDLKAYLSKNKDKKCKLMQPIYIQKEYIEFENTQVKLLSQEEAERYLQEQKCGL